MDESDFGKVLAGMTAEDRRHLLGVIECLRTGQLDGADLDAAMRSGDADALRALPFVGEAGRTALGRLRSRRQRDGYRAHRAVMTTARATSAPQRPPV